MPIHAGIGASNIASREDHVAYAIKKIITDNQGIFIDVGTNVGQTLLHVLKCDKSRQYVGFDVQATCVAYVQRLILENHLENVSIYPFGLSNKNAYVDVFIREIADLSASIDKNFRRESFYKGRTQGMVRHGDAVIDELGLDKICLIKIDVEGAEADVIEGLRGTLDAKRPHVICEILPSGRVDNERIKQHRQKNIQRVKSAFESLRYLFYRIKPDCTIEKVEFLDPDTFDIAYCNYLFAPEMIDESSF